MKISFLNQILHGEFFFIYRMTFQIFFFISFKISDNFLKNCCLLNVGNFCGFFKITAIKISLKSFFRKKLFSSLKYIFRFNFCDYRFYFFFCRTVKASFSELFLGQEICLIRKLFKMRNWGNKKYCGV